MVAVTNIGSEQLCSCSVPSRSTAVKPPFCTFLIRVTTGSRDQLYQGATSRNSSSWVRPFGQVAHGTFAQTASVTSALRIYIYVIIAKVFITKLVFARASGESREQWKVNLVLKPMQEGFLHCFAGNNSQLRMCSGIFSTWCWEWLLWNAVVWIFLPFGMSVWLCGVLFSHKFNLLLWPTIYSRFPRRKLMWP